MPDLRRDVRHRPGADQRNHVGPQEFPQGGWTEAWNEQGAPAVRLAAICAELGFAAVK